MPRIAILTILLSLLLAAPAPAFRHKETRGPATLEVYSDSDGATIALADLVYVVVTIDGTKGLEVDGMLGLAEGAPWEMIAAAPARLKIGEDGRGRWQQTLTLAPTAPGSLSLELTPLTFRDSDEKQTVRFTPRVISIVTTIKDLTAATARDIRTTEDPPSLPPAVNSWPWIALTTLIVPVALAGAWLALRQRRRAAPASALRKAMRECDRVLALERADGKARVILVTGIVRRYLERRYGIATRHLTTAELLRSTDGRADLADDAKGWLRTFFAEADRIRYAAAHVTDSRCRELIEAVRRFCTETTPRPS